MWQLERFVHFWFIIRGLAVAGDPHLLLLEVQFVLPCVVSQISTCHPNAFQSGYQCTQLQEHTKNNTSISEILQQTLDWAVKKKKKKNEAELSMFHCIVFSFSVGSSFPVTGQLKFVKLTCLHLLHGHSAVIARFILHFLHI